MSSLLLTDAFSEEARSSFGFVQILFVDCCKNSIFPPPFRVIISFQVIIWLIILSPFIAIISLQVTKCLTPFLRFDS